jgi:hypothetical protein
VYHPLQVGYYNKMARLTQTRSLGYELLPGKARRYRNVQTGETVSYNAFRRLANARSSEAASKVHLFEQALARSNDLQLARRESGLSGREFEQYRHSFGDRESANPFVKEHGRWTFRGARGFQHTFLNPEGRETSAIFSGRNLIAMQDYRAAISEHSHDQLDAWAGAHPYGVTDDSGQVHHPETQLARIDSSLRRMGKRQRTRFHQQQFYASAT